MSKDATKIVDRVGPGLTLELAGVILASAAASEDPGQKELGGRLIGELIDEVERRTLMNEGSETPTYIADIWADDITYHRARDNGRTWVTSCGVKLSWKAVSIMLPYRLAVKLGHPCQKCYTDVVDLD